MTNPDPKLVEAVARAMCEADGQDPNKSMNPLNPNGPLTWWIYNEEAQAAIRVCAEYFAAECEKSLEATRDALSMIKKDGPAHLTQRLIGREIEVLEMCDRIRELGGVSENPKQDKAAN